MIPYSCVAMDSIIRVVGALSLWSAEIIMQLRVYALYKCSRRVRSLVFNLSSSAFSISPSELFYTTCDIQVAIFNTVLFLGSITGFLWILVHNAERRRAVIANAIHLPLPGCPSIHTGIEWAQWVPGQFHSYSWLSNA